MFAAILDRDAGGFRFSPADVEVAAARRYVPGTMVLKTSWGTAAGWVVVRDVLLIGPWHHEVADMAEESDELQIIYGVGGEHELTEEVLDHLDGHEGARPVRVGNEAYDQRQHDVWGQSSDPSDCTLVHATGLTSVPGG